MTAFFTSAIHNI